MGTSPTLGIAVNDGFHNPARVHAFLALGARFQTFRVSGDFVWKRTALVILCLLMCGCSGWHATPDPSIEFSRVPPAEDGGPDKLDIIEGRVIGARPGQRIVLYVRSGIDPDVVRAGRDGHWGLSGMRERAERIGARFRVLSAASAGTEIELSVPGHIDFQFPPSHGRWGWLSKLKLRMAQEEEPRQESKKGK